MLVRVSPRSGLARNYEIRNIGCNCIIIIAGAATFALQLVHMRALSSSVGTLYHCILINNTMFSEITMVTFPKVGVCRNRWPGSGEALMIHAKVGIWQHC